jgi:hypothetical protein
MSGPLTYFPLWKSAFNVYNGNLCIARERTRSYTYLEEEPFTPDYPNLHLLLLESDSLVTLKALCFGEVYALVP